MADQRMPAQLIDTEEDEELDPETEVAPSVDLGERFAAPLVDMAAKDTPDEEPEFGKV